MGRYPALSRLAPETWNGTGSAYLQSRYIRPRHRNSILRNSEGVLPLFFSSPLFSYYFLLPSDGFLCNWRVKLISMTRPCMSLITVLIIFPGFLARSSAPDDNSRMAMARTVFVHSACTMLYFRSLLDLRLSTPLESAAARNMSQSQFAEGK
ncbi:hypothetical protein CEXT_308641 [Caerostris extrusa]|uniref:Uncharacterized protein n=1 Tax=Caerostris extrusa TaxID=172846 RepID=A0AAV4XKV9_CAEEX|nr:hypothetical protein CEXT_308641 [Caerostris extrusa]